MDNIDIVSTFKLLLKDLDFPWVERDYLLRRLANEGMPFLVTKLPQLYKYVLSCIESKSFAITKDFTAFNFRDSSSLRRWRLELSSLNSGGDLSISFLYQIATICNYYYKLALPFNQDQLDAAEIKYSSTQTEIGELRDTYLYSPVVERVRKYVETHYDLTNLNVHEAINSGREGPGSVVGAKHPRLYKDSRDGLCHPEYRASSGVFRYRRTSIYTGRRMRIKILTQPDKMTCQVVFVAKDARGPRVISKETHSKAKLSLGFHDYIKPHLEKVTHGKVQFTDQTIFQELAKRSSIDGYYATLDLESASDRHSNLFARRVYRNIPVIRWFLNHSRANTYVLPSGKTGELACVAGMGSGLTFPLMALSIHATIAAELTFRGFKSEAKDIYVYGDDIIVPKHVVQIAISALHSVGFRVNIQKSFWIGKFRESCGGDFYKGVSVTPVRLKQTFCDNFLTKDLRLKPDAHSRDAGNADKFFFKLERHCRLLVQNGLHRLAEYYYSVIEKYLNNKCMTLSVTNDSTTPHMARYEPNRIMPDRIGVNTPVFCPLLKEGYMNRLILSKLGGEIHKGQFRSWLTGGSLGTGGYSHENRSHPYSLAMSQNEEWFCIPSAIPLQDSVRYAGYLRT